MVPAAFRMGLPSSVRPLGNSFTACPEVGLLGNAKSNQAGSEDESPHGHCTMQCGFSVYTYIVKNLKATTMCFRWT